MSHNDCDTCIMRYACNVKGNDTCLMRDQDKIIRQATEAILREKEAEAYKELRDRGIIGEGALFVHTIHREHIEQMLFAEGIKRVPIIYTDLIEKDKMIFTTDKELVKTARQMCGYGEEEASE